MGSKLIVGGNKEERKQTALKIAQKNLGQPITPPHPDFLVLEGENSLSIQAVRNLQKSLARKPYFFRLKIAFIHEAEKLTLPAQNALLKTLEEPPAQTLLILTAPKTESLIPTIISRCQIIRLGEVRLVGEKANSDAQKILIRLPKMRVGERLKLAQELSKDKTQTCELVLNLLVLSRKNLLEKPTLRAAQNLYLLQKTLSLLEANVNPLLALGNLFLGLH
jgi:DNA polymerase III gamma/tau subunit